jgi:acyl carrier protein
MRPVAMDAVARKEVTFEKTPIISQTTNNPAVLDQFQSIQQETLQVHSKFLENDAEYTRLFSQLTQQELSLISGNSTQATLEQINIALQTLDRSIAQFHQHQSETLRIHEQYLNNQVDLLKNTLEVSQPGNGLQSSFKQVNAQQEAPVFQTSRETSIKPVEQSQVGNNGNGHTPEPVLPAAVAPKQVEVPLNPAAVDVNNLTGVLLDIVSEKTGYPTEMLELTMDMEADLGIDSIKRVEILGAMQTAFPELPKADATALSEMRTLGQIVEYMTSSAGETSIPLTQLSAVSRPQSVEVSEISSTVESAGSGKVSIKEITAALLEIVSEKTGYPTEMLEMGMDMEADLGIDSIKRVEILGAMQERFPELPKADAAALAEMRTLAQITEYMSSTSVPAETKSEISNASSAVDALEIVPTRQAEITPISLDIDGIKQSLLDVVSEKTGYPTEMLELTMDMEADLGIDSIKRVEILGAMQEKYPDLPKADATTLAEMHTLQQIIESFSNQPTDSTEVVKLESLEITQSPELVRGVISMKSLPLPDHLTTEKVANQVSLIVNDGSELTLKLVEKMNGLGNKVIVLSLPEELVQKTFKLNSSIEQISLSEVSEENIQTALNNIERDHGAISIFIHLDPANNEPKAFSNNEKEIVKTVFLLAKHLKEALSNAGKKGYAAFVTVTHLDGQFGLSLNSSVEPVSGGLFGLTKTLNLEWEDVFCRAIDLQPDMNEELAADCITAELFDPNRLISEVAYNKNGRFTLAVDLPEIERIA